MEGSNFFYYEFTIEPFLSLMNYNFDFSISFQHLLETKRKE
jgi:hypothetical protein